MADKPNYVISLSSCTVFRHFLDGTPDTLTRFDYAYWDNAVQSAIGYDKNFSMAAPNGDYYDDALQFIDWQGHHSITFSSSFGINGIGQTISAAVNDRIAKTLLIRWMPEGCPLSQRNNKDTQ